jgi:hypothetical protein
LQAQRHTTATEVQNVAVGYAAGSAISTGTFNTCIGGEAGDTIETGYDNVIIGFSCTTSSSSGNNQIVMGDNIAGDSNGTFTFGSSAGQVHNHFGTDATWTRTSDERLKKNITDTDLGLSFINDLRTVKYNWKGHHELDTSDKQLEHLFKNENGENKTEAENEIETDITMHGFVAQEVKAALDAAGVDDWAGWEEDRFGVQRISREMFVIPLVKAVQELSTQVTALQAEIEKLKSGG